MISNINFLTYDNNFDVKKIISNILAVLFGFFLSIIIGELIVRVFFPEDGRCYNFDINYSNFSPHIYKTQKNTSDVYTYLYRTNDKRTYKVSFNSKGLRDVEHEYKKAKNTFRILGLGDSFTWGTGVELKNTYLKLLERMLNREIRNKVETINAGIPGWGTAQELIFFKEEGYKYNPDLVTLGFYVFNDYLDNTLLGLYKIKNKKLIRSIPPSLPYPISLREFLFNSNSIFAPGFYIKKSFFLKSITNRINNLTSFSSYFSIDPDYYLGNLLIEELSNEVKKHNAKFLLIVIPSSPVHSRELSEVEPSKNYKELIRCCKKLKINYLDLYPVLKTNYEKLDSFFIPADGHFTIEGNQLVAKEMFKYIIASGLLKSPLN